MITVALPTGETIDVDILVQIDRKDDRRAGSWLKTRGIVGSKSGIPDEAIRKTKTVPSEDKHSKISPTEPLKKGEYIVYVVGSADKIKEILGRGYDFRC